MARFYFLVGLTSLSLFGYSQYKGYDLFDDTNTNYSRGSTARSTFHK
jgi:hypothetical protein